LRAGLLIRCRMDDPPDKEFKISVGARGTVIATAMAPSSTNQFGVFLPINQNIEDRPWSIIAYEVWMYFGTRSKMKTPTCNDDVIRNAVVESAIVHARILCDIFLSKKSQWGGNILLADRFADWRSNSYRLKDLKSKIKKLRQAYGHSKKDGSPYQVFHQKALHADQARYPTFHGYDYADQFKVLDPLSRDVVEAIEAARGPLFTLA